MTYKIVRFFADPEIGGIVIRRGLSLDAAQAHCRDPETSSATATSREAVARTEQYGQWFDGYEEES